MELKKRIPMPKTVVIIGHGYIGRSKSLKPLSKKSHFDPPKLPSLEEVLEKADIVISACSLKQNVGFINENSFKRMKKNVLFINPARGKLVNEKHLIHFLEKNSEAFAFLDVFEQEPLSFEKFAHLQNVKLSSHIAGVFNNIDQSIIDFETDILRSYREAYQSNEIPSLFEGPFKSLLLKNKIHNNFMT